jgi:hypothetical protein
MDVIWRATAAIGAIAVNLMASELFAWGPRLSERLMCGAVRRLAPEMQARMREEWAGHLQTIPPGLWRIVAAAGFYLATRQINVALRVWERQERPDEEMLHEKVSRKTEGPPILNVNVGMTKLAVLNAYVSRYAKIEGKGWVLIPGPRDEPEPQSTPRSSQDR